MTETKPKSRWFRFSLRMLFVLVTIIALPLSWVAYQLNWIRQRHAFMYGSPRKFEGLAAGWEDPAFKAPWALNLFGEKPIKYFLEVQEQYVSEATALFPEAKINPPFLRRQKPSELGSAPPPAQRPDTIKMSPELRRLFPQP